MSRLSPLLPLIALACTASAGAQFATAPGERRPGVVQVAGPGQGGGHDHHPGGNPFPPVGLGWGWWMWMSPAPIVVMPPPQQQIFFFGMNAPAAPPPAPVPAPRPRVRRPSPARLAELVTFGDRLFRVGNLHRAEERFKQAAAEDPKAALPRARLAQVELRRGNYAEAADRLREALAAEPGWLARAPDIRELYTDPVDFARELAKLESRVQAAPGDRSALLVLGAELYLSGRVAHARDVFLRLADRRPDPALSAFLDASRAAAPAP